ncbi:LarC family nickel insertion protein, partial [bacterium]
VMELEANIDDMNPEFFEYIFERLFAGGALDVFSGARPDEKEPPGQSAAGSLCGKRPA